MKKICSNCGKEFGEYESEDICSEVDICAECDLLIYGDIDLDYIYDGYID